MKGFVVLAGILVLMFAGGAKGNDPTVADVNHWDLQAVDEDGYGTYSPAQSDKVILRGIVLNNPEEILNPTPGQGFMGGQWQIYIQGEGNDHAGTAVWLGQNYSKVTSSDDYTDEELLAEMYRINHDPCTGYVFAAGDRIKVTGWYKFYKGKTNVNEKHDVNDFYDFTVELLEPAVGLPQPEVITLGEVKDYNDNFIFDAGRLTGCEYYQGRLVRINDVNIADANDWEPDGMLTIRNANGLTFPVKLGIGAGISRFDCPAGQIDVIGIFDQESSGYMVCKDGYRIWVTNYDGNGLVLIDRGHQRGNIPGDINGDFKVDFIDFAEFAADWLKCAPGLCDCD